jgi:predicted TPR repeat methyltransferase
MDIGCGTASTADLLPNSATYVGIDITEKYLHKARRRRPYVSLIQGDVSKKDWITSVSLVDPTMCIALGIFHHLNDYQLNAMLENCLSVLPSGSEIFSMDPVIVPNSSRSARWFADNDRGKFVRSPEEIDRFLTSKGLQVVMSTRSNEMKIPLDTLEITSTMA